MNNLSPFLIAALMSAAVATPSLAGETDVPPPAPMMVPTEIPSLPPTTPSQLGSPQQIGNTFNSAAYSPNASLPTASYPTANPQNCSPTCFNLGVAIAPGSSVPNITGSFTYSPNQSATDLQNELKKREQMQQRLLWLEARRQINNDLATAIEQKQWGRARILAFQLMGAKNYRDYLMRVTGGQFPNP